MKQPVDDVWGAPGVPYFFVTEGGSQGSNAWSNPIVAEETPNTAEVEARTGHITPPPPSPSRDSDVLEEQAQKGTEELDGGGENAVAEDGRSLGREEEGGGEPGAELEEEAEEEEAEEDNLAEESVASQGDSPSVPS